MSHPSFLALDRHALGIKVPEVEAHLPGCEQCAGHVARVSQPAPVPQSLGETVKPRPFWTLRMAWVFAPVAVMGVAVLALPGDEARSKGTPGLAVYVRHGSQVSRWDGKSSLAVGDALQLEVSPAGFPHLTVLQPGGTTLYEADIDANKALLLPQSWTLDAAPGPERITVVFSYNPLSSAELGQLVAVPRSSRLWTVPLVVPKEPSP